VESSLIDPDDLFRAVTKSGARALIIGRQALILLGAPVITGDFDFWLHRDDIAPFNAALEPLGYTANRSPEDARQWGRYKLEDGDQVDVLVARGVSTVDGVMVHFDDVWSRRQTLWSDTYVSVEAPSIVDLIATKRFAARPKDAEDIRYLTVLLSKQR